MRLRLSAFWKPFFILLPASTLLTTVQAADTFEIDPAHSTALFRVKHFDVSYYNGRFNDVSGTIVFDPENPSSSQIRVEIKADSVFTANERRDGHIKSPDFLNSAQFPVLTFKSSSVRKTGDGTYEVSGDFTVRGVTKPLIVSVEHVGTRDAGRGRVVAGFSTQFTINRREFEVSYGSAEVLADEVLITIDVEARKQ